MFRRVVCRFVRRGMDGRTVRFRIGRGLVDMNGRMVLIVFCVSRLGPNRMKIRRLCRVPFVALMSSWLCVDLSPVGVRSCETMLDARGSVFW